MLVIQQAKPLQICCRGRDLLVVRDPETEKLRIFWVNDLSVTANVPTVNPAAVFVCVVGLHRRPPYKMVARGCP